MLGVSSDTPGRLSSFRDANNVPFPFASDPKREIIRLYGARRPGPLAPFTKRVTFVIDRSGTIRGAFQHEIVIPWHTRDVLDCIARLGPASPGDSAC